MQNSRLEKTLFSPPGHTINFSKQFVEKFGYDFALFFLPTLSVQVEDLGDVHFIPLIPIYKEERKWMEENNSFDWLKQFFENNDIDSILIDKKRKAFIPKI